MDTAGNQALSGRRLSGAGIRRRIARITRFQTATDRDPAARTGERVSGSFRERKGGTCRNVAATGGGPMASAKEAGCHRCAPGSGMESVCSDGVPAVSIYGTSKDRSCMAPGARERKIRLTDAIGMPDGRR